MVVIIDEKLLKEFRKPGACEWCGRWSDPRQPHHIIKRGQGGGNRMDLRLNLISFGHQYCCDCHDCAEYRVPGQDIMPNDCFAKVAARESKNYPGITQDVIRMALEFVRRYDKKTLPGQRERLLDKLDLRVKKVVEPILEEWA